MMARQEQDREDLLRDATAFVERVEVILPELAAPVFVGFRRNGCASVYVDQDPTYHFNTSGELRRAYVDGRLYKSEHGRLVSMVRERTTSEVQLVRHDLSATETSAFLQAMHQCLSKIGQRLNAGEFSMVGQVPDDGDSDDDDSEDIDVVARVQRWFEMLPEEIAIAASPRAI